MWPPDWPDNWLDWITLVGSAAGIVAATKLFLFDRWLNLTQCRFIVAAYLSEHKTVSASHVLGGGWVFHIPNEKRSENYYNYFITGASDKAASYQNLIYLKELTNKGYFVYIQEKTGIEGIYDNTYHLTAKGLRSGRFLRFITLTPRVMHKK